MGKSSNSGSLVGSLAYFRITLKLFPRNSIMVEVGLNEIGKLIVIRDIAFLHIFSSMCF